jgi:hypothetical protein
VSAPPTVDHPGAGTRSHSIAGGASIARAFHQGVAALRLKGLADRPQLLVRPGVDARTIVLADRAPDGGFRRRA